MREPTKKRLGRIPNMEKPFGNLLDSDVYLHFFHPAGDWYATHYDGEDTFFGFVVLAGFPGCEEWGYFTYSQLKSLGPLMDCEHEMYFPVQPARGVRIINKCSCVKKAN